MAEKILIVDDDPETLRLVGLMLQRQGFQTLSAKNGAEGLWLADNEKPDLIVLDLMMPDVDGYQVAKKLKSDPATANITLLVFTAKSQAEDRIAGIEAGADDYLTKPVRPAELIAHIKALLSRAKIQTPTPQVKRGRVIGVLAAKGGLGVSSLALNLGILLEQRLHLDTIAAELRPGLGTWAGELGFANATGLANILAMPEAFITPETVTAELIKTTYGIRLLLASAGIRDISILYEGERHLSALINVLSGMAQAIILDIGTPFFPALEKVLDQCDELCVVSEPQPYCLRRTSQLVNDLGELGFGEAKKVNIVIINRVRADLQLAAVQIQEMLGRPIHLVVPPVPELSYHAAMRNTPLSVIQQDGIYTQQVLRLATKIAETIHQ